MINRELLFECVVLLRPAPGTSIPVSRGTAGRKSPEEAGRWAPTVWFPFGDLECGVSLSLCPLMAGGTFGHLLGEPAQKGPVVCLGCRPGGQEVFHLPRLAWAALCVFCPFWYRQPFGSRLVWVFCFASTLLRACKSCFSHLGQK